MSIRKSAHKCTFIFALSFIGLKALALEIPKLETFFPTEVTKAWDGKEDPTAKASMHMLNRSDEKMNSLDFDQIARWSPLQGEFVGKSYDHLIKKEMNLETSRKDKAKAIAGLLLGYEYSVEPSFNNGLFTRLDRYYVSGGTDGRVSLKSWQDSSARLHLIPGYQLNYSFYRQFNQAKTALLSAL